MTEYFPPAFDGERLLEIAMGDRQLGRRLIEAFLRQLPGVREQLRAADRREDLFDVLHQICGSCRFIAAERLASLLNGIEDNERARHMPVSLIIDTVLGELEDIENALQSEISRWEAAPDGEAP